MVQKTFKVAEVEISYKPKYKVGEQPQISKSNDACQILIQQWNMNRIELLEEFKSFCSTGEIEFLEWLIFHKED